MLHYNSIVFKLNALSVLKQNSSYHNLPELKTKTKASKTSPASIKPINSTHKNVILKKITKVLTKKIPETKHTFQSTAAAKTTRKSFMQSKGKVNGHNVKKPIVTNPMKLNGFTEATRFKATRAPSVKSIKGIVLNNKPLVKPTPKIREGTKIIAKKIHLDNSEKYKRKICR